MAQQQDTGRQTVRLPLYGYDKAYGAGSYGFASAWEWHDQVFVNCYPMVNKNPVQDDAGEVTIMSRPGIRYPVSGSGNTINADMNTCLASVTSMAEPLAVLGIKGLATETIIAVYSNYVGGADYLRVVAYVPGTGATLVGAVNITTYGLNNGNVEVHLTQITNGAGLPGIAMVFHPENYRSSTYLNSDCYYSICTAGVWGALAAIGSNFPTNNPINKGLVGPLQQLNNVHYVMTVDGYIYGSYPSTTFPFNPDITTWNTQGNTATVQSPDGGVGLARYKHHLLAFGQNSCEFFNDEGLAQPNLPIRRTQQAFFKTGLLNARSCINVDDDLYFLGVSGDNGFVGLYRLSGYTPELVSSTKINTTFLDRANYYACLQTINLNGSRHIVTNVYHTCSPNWQSLPVAENPTNTELGGILMYCIDSHAWWLLSMDYSSKSYNEGKINLQIANTGSGSVNNQWIYVVMNEYGSSGYNYSIHPAQMFSYSTISSEDNYDKLRQENTTGPEVYANWTIPVKFITNTFDLGTTNRKTIHRIRLVTDRPTNETSVSSPVSDFNAIGHTLALGIWKDRKADASEYNTAVDLSTQFDLINLIDNPTLNWNNLGTMRRFKLTFQCSTWVHLRFEAFEVTYTQAQH